MHVVWVILFVEELRKEKRDEVFHGKRVRFGEEDNLEYEFTISDVMNSVLLLLYCLLSSVSKTWTSMIFHNITITGRISMIFGRVMHYSK